MAQFAPGSWSYAMTLHTQELLHKVVRARKANAFALYNLGDGPVLNYRAQYSRVEAFIVDLRKGENTLYLDKQSKPPYFIVLAQERAGHPGPISVFLSGSYPVLEDR